MRVLLRIVGCATVVASLWTLFLLSPLWESGEFVPRGTDVFGYLNYLSCLVTLVIGPIAAVKLLRLRPGAPVWGAIVWGNIVLHHLGAVVRSPLLSLEVPIFGLSVLVFAVLVISIARRSLLEGGYSS
jgi:hypothetical protein